MQLSFPPLAEISPARYFRGEPCPGSRHKSYPLAPNDRPPSMSLAIAMVIAQNSSQPSERSAKGTFIWPCRVNLSVFAWEFRLRRNFGDRARDGRTKNPERASKRRSGERAINTKFGKLAIERTSLCAPSTRLFRFPQHHVHSWGLKNRLEGPLARTPLR